MLSLPRLPPHSSVSRNKFTDRSCLSSVEKRFEALIDDDRVMHGKGLGLTFCLGVFSAWLHADLGVLVGDGDIVWQCAVCNQKRVVWK